jgi:FKBP-type peptidyl-prolyl cis-trans isomerase (trigger factor)
MKVNLEKLEGLAHRFSFEIAADKVSEAFEEATRNYKRVFP